VIVFGPWWRFGQGAGGEWSWIGRAVVLGAVAAVALARSATFERRNDESALRAALQSIAAIAVVDYARTGAIPTAPERYRTAAAGYQLEIRTVEERGVVFELAVPEREHCRLTVWRLTPTQASAEHTLCDMPRTPSGAVVIR